MGWYTVAIAAALAIFVIGAITGHTINRGIAAHATKTNVEQVAPLELMTKARNLPVQANSEPF
jgi:hypothetical protein